MNDIGCVRQSLNLSAVPGFSGEFSPEFVVIVVSIDEKDIAGEGFEPVDVLSVCAGTLDTVALSTGFLESIFWNTVSGQEREPEITADDDSIVVGKCSAQKAFRIDFVDFQWTMCVPEYMQKHLLSLLSFGQWARQHLEASSTMTPNAGEFRSGCVYGQLAAVPAGRQPAARAAPSLHSIVQNGMVLPP